MLDESRLENTIRPVAEGSDVVKAGGSGLEVNEGEITYSKHPENAAPIIGCDDQIVSTKYGIRETPKLQINTPTRDTKPAPTISRRARIRTRHWSCGWKNRTSELDVDDTT